MYPVTQAFTEQMRADKRRVLGRVQIDFTDPFLDQSIYIEVSEQSNISYPEQVADGISESYARFAALDGAWVLGEDWALAPSPDEAATKQMGWWGMQLADANGYFTQPYPILIITHAERPIHSLRVTGDSKRGEYPTDFLIKLYDAENTLLYTETVTGNMQVAWQKSLSQPVLGVVKQELIITRWSHDGRQVKILEFFTAIQETYEGDDIFYIALLEEREISQGSLPVGNISANEITIRLNNETRKFDASNPNSPLLGLIKPNRRIKAWLGIDNNGTKEWVPLGIFWCSDWEAPEDDIYAQTRGRDRLELLRKSTYSTSQVQINKTLYDLAIAVLQDADLKSDEYWVDTELQEFVVPYAYFEPQSHREALRKISEACLGQVFCDRNGTLRIEGLSYTERRIEEQLASYFLEGAYPAEITALEVYGIGPDDYFTKNSPSKSNEMANYIEVETQPLKPAAIAEEIYRSNEVINVPANSTKSLTVYYNKIPCIEAIASLEGATNTVIQEVTYYAWGAGMKLYNPGGTAENVTLVINAKPLSVQNKEKAIAKDDISIRENGLIRYTFPGNPLVQTLDVAQKIADKLLQSFKDPRRDVELDWCGNPALELGDIVMIADYQRGREDVRGFYYITRQELEWDGALRAKLEGRRAI